MTGTDLPQAEADELIALEKRKISDRIWNYPGGGERVAIPIVSLDGREEFFFDLSRGSINLQKGKYQNRARNIVVLVRLDFGGGPHRNPDGEELPSPHLHIYREGHADKWAVAVPGDFSDVDDPWQTWHDFQAYCNVTDPPDVQGRLFSP